MPVNQTFQRNTHTVGTTCNGSRFDQGIERLGEFIVYSGHKLSHGRQYTILQCSLLCTLGGHHCLWRSRLDWFVPVRLVASRERYEPASIRARMRGCTPSPWSAAHLWLEEGGDEEGVIG
jgi:hypothetical protein